MGNLLGAGFLIVYFGALVLAAYVVIHFVTKFW